MTHKVLLTPKAAEDAEAIYRWIAGDAPDTAADWYHGLLDAFASLDALPNRCPVAREARRLRRDVRQLLHGNYRILFIIEGRVVRILRVRHGAMRACAVGILKEEKARRPRRDSPRKGIIFPPRFRPSLVLMMHVCKTIDRVVLKRILSEKYQLCVNGSR